MALTIGARVRQFRAAAGITIKVLAEASGMSLTYISDIERDRTKPTLETLEALGRGLGVSAVHLLLGTRFDTPRDYPTDISRAEILELRGQLHEAEAYLAEARRTLHGVRGVIDIYYPEGGDDGNG